jgi:anaerobic magnesium-protoporphyrin IX monomethyl ester cyclase
VFLNNKNKLNKKMSDVLFVQPPYLQVPLDPLANETLDLLSDYAEKIGMFGLTRNDLTPPTAMLSVAQRVIDYGYRVAIADMYLEEIYKEDPWPFLRRELKRKDPAIVGVANGENCILEATVSVANAVKGYNEEIIVVCGGINATALDVKLLQQHRSIDVVVRGEGEKTFSELSDAVYKSRPFKGVEGITFRNNGRITRNPDRPFMSPEEIPLPARDIYPLKRLYRAGGDADMIFASRGCPFKCSFCNTPPIWHGCWVGRPVESVIDELMIMKEYGASKFHLWDQNFGGNQKWATQICDRIIEERLDMDWETEIRIDALNDNFVKKITSSGCNVAFVGIESEDQAILDSVNKRYNVSIQEKALKTAKQHGLFLEGGYVAGLPEDNKSTIDATIKKALKYFRDGLAVPLFFLFVPFPGTEIGDAPEKFGIKIEDVGSENYHFISPKPLASTKHLTAKEVFDLWRNGQQQILAETKSKLAEAG